MATDAALLAARLLLAYLFVTSGLSGLQNIGGTEAYFAGLGFPSAALFAWGVSLFELFAGLLVAVGLRARPAAFLLAVFSVAAGFLGHYGQGAGDPMLAFMHSQALMKDIAIAGGFLALSIAGAGKWSADGWRH
jgi:putative oxidoreductase